MNYDTLAGEEVLKTAVKSLEDKGYMVTVVESATKALEEVKQLIPSGSSVMNGSSVTLEKIGYIDYLKSNTHPWKNLHFEIVNETDPEKQTVLRQMAVHSDFYLGSVHALTENGDLIIASNTGSQLPHIVYTSKNLVFVVSTKKIVTNLDEGLKRLEEHVVPLEDKHSIEKYGRGTQLNKIVIFKGENGNSGRKVHLVLVKEDLGF